MTYATEATVDLGAIEANLAGVRARVGDRAVLLAIKADAYGHGAVPVAQRVQANGSADWLGVATVPEAEQLRAAGINLPILKLSHAFDDELPAAIDLDVALTLVDEDTTAAAQRAAAAADRTVEVHLKVDTGMRRIGVDPPRATALAQLIDAQPNLSLTGIYTHLPVSDDPVGDGFTEAQMSWFNDVVQNIEVSLGRDLPYVHAANSGGILGHPSTWGTMVRPGVMAYGYYPDPSTPRTVDLRPSLTWSSRVSFAKRIVKGESVGYGLTWTADRDTTIVTVPIGYADGFSRLNSNAGSMLIRGRRYPVVGRVCMDQTMLDVGDDTVAVGDEAVVIGRSGDEEITVADLAAVMGTITYEVTSLIAPRVRRKYVG